MKITIRKTGNDEMIVNFSYHPFAVEKIKSLPYKSRKWDKIAKVWVVDLSQLENIYRLFSDCQIDADESLIELYSKKSEMRERSEIEVKELIKNVPDRVNGYELFAHQKEAVPQMLTARKCILGHEQGLGKSLVALVAAKILQPRPVEIIAPISVHSSWQSFADECGVKLSGLHSWAKIPKDISENTVLIADEVHKAQGGVTTQRGKAFLNLAKKAEFLFELSGTPMRNDRALNIFPLLEACDHPIAQNFFAFRERYCVKRDIYRKGKEPIAIYDGIQNESELRNKIGDVLFVKKKVDCLDLPEKIYQWRKVENCLTGELSDDLGQLVEEYLDEKSWKEDFSDSYFDELRRKAKFQVIRRLTSLAKVDGTCDIAQDILDQGESVVICTAFLEPLHKIAEKFKDYGVSVIHGGVKADDRGQAVKDFQIGKNKVFVFTIEAGGVGITLTKAAYIIMHDRTWVPGDVDQAIDRVHRISQDKTVFVTSVSVNRMDYIIDKVLARKSKYINKVIY